MLKVAAYARVSTDKEDQINSLTNQREYFESYIKSKDDWEFVEVYFDAGITGTQTKKRKGFNRMINDCKNGKIDLILTVYFLFSLEMQNIIHLTSRQK